MKTNMYQPIQLQNMKTLSVTNPISRSPLWRGLLLIPLLFAFWEMPGTVHAQQLQGGSLFVTNNLGGFCGNGGSSIYQYTPQYAPPDGTPTIFASNLAAPRGVAFDNDGNLYVATNSADDSCITQGTIFKITPDGFMSTLASGFGTNIILSGLAIDTAGNVFVMTEPGSQIGASTIYKVSPGGAVSTFGYDETIQGSIPGSFGMGLAFDPPNPPNPQNLYAADPDNGIYKFDSQGVRSDFALLDKFTQGPFGLVFDNFGNLYVSGASGNYGYGEILKFAYPDWTESTIATGLTHLPKGIARDDAGNLFIAETGVPGTNSGEMLEFTPGGTGTIQDISLASGWGVIYFDQTNFPTIGNRGPQWLAFTTRAVTPPTSAVALTFPNVTTAGTTTVTPIVPAPTPPSQFDLNIGGLPVLAYEITTTVTYTVTEDSPIIIAFQVPADYASQFQDLRVLHNGDDVTCPIPNPGPTPDPTTLTIYASVTSLSPFEIVKLKFRAQVQEPINADGSSVFSVRRGVVPVKFTLTQDGTSTCTLPAATIAVTRTAGGTVGAIDESVYSGSADNGSNFRIDSCHYVYNLSASALGVGTYRVDILMGGFVVGSGTFGLK